MEQANALATFAIMLVSGITLGLLYDLYRSVRRWGRWGTAWTALGDLLYWLLATSITFLVLVLCNDGELRAYVFIALAVGTYSYFRLGSNVVLRILTGFFRRISWLSNGIKKNAARINLLLKRGKPS